MGSIQELKIFWNYVIIAYKKGGETDSSESCLIVRYNIALAYWNTNKYWSAINELREIEKINPEYKNDEIKEMINSALKMAKFNEAPKAAGSATKLFDEETYDQARAYYREAIKLYLKAGLEENNPEICRLSYNIAMAFIKSTMFYEALETLERIQKINPKYDPELVSEKIKKISELIELLE